MAPRSTRFGCCSTTLAGGTGLWRASRGPSTSTIGTGAVDHGGGLRNRQPRPSWQASPPAPVSTPARNFFATREFWQAVETYPGMSPCDAPGPRQQPPYLLRCLAATQLPPRCLWMDPASLEADAKNSGPANDYNVAVTKEVVDVAHAIGRDVERRTGFCLALLNGKGGLKTAHGFDGATLSATSWPQRRSRRSRRFPLPKPRSTPLAIAIGNRATAPTNSHAQAHRRSGWPSPGSPKIHKAISQHPTWWMPGSELWFPRNWLETLIKPVSVAPSRNRKWRARGRKSQTGIRNGVRKINIDTDNRLAFTAGRP